MADGRLGAIRQLLLGVVVIPYSVALFVALVVVGILVWVLNSLWMLVTGSALVSGNSRLGYALYVAQNNLQAVITGRGEVVWVPFSR